MIIIVAAVISSLFRALTPWASEYKHQVEDHLSTILGEPVHIQSMETGWYWFEPVIKLGDVRVSDGQNNFIELKKLLIGINVIDSIWHWQVQPGILYVDNLKLKLKQQNKKWTIEGIDIGENSLHQFDKTSYYAVLAWILEQQKIVVKHLAIDAFLENGEKLSVQHINLTISKRLGEYQLAGSASLDKTNTSRMQVAAHLSLDPLNLGASRGEVYFRLKNIHFAQLKHFLPFPKLKDDLGKGTIKSWISIDKGSINNIQADVRLKHFYWRQIGGIENLDVQSLKGNFAWQRTEKGWSLQADRLKMRVNGTRWPENSLAVSYNNDKNFYNISARNIILSSIIALLPNKWQDSTLETMKALHPVGFLYDTRIQIEDGQIKSLLTQFNRLGWRMTQDFPGADNLSGVLDWQPYAGRLAFDCEKAILRPVNMPPLRLSLLNGNLQWQKAGDKYKVIVNRFVLQHPDLLLNLQGSLDELTSPAAGGQIDVTGQIAATKAEQWLSYVPMAMVKEKLYDWLKNDVHQIDSAVAEINIHGAVTDFPFDNKPGEFSIKSHLQGVDLNFAQGWPVSKNLEAYLTIDKRTLNADIVHGNLHGILIDKANLRINDIGHDRETLLIHTQVETATNKALAYIMDSPLKNKLSVLNTMAMNGAMGLDLRLELPLYTENETNLVLGDLTFRDNNVAVDHVLDKLKLKHVNGTLQFDQNGVLDSNFNALLMDYPVHILIQSVRDNKKPYTSVKISGKTDLDILREKFKVPLLSLMQGTLNLESRLMITDEPNDLDHLQLTTDLQGVDINLPPPFGKIAAVKSPLTMDIDFNPEKAVRVQLNYKNFLAGDLWFTGRNGDLRFSKGVLRFGGAKVAEPTQGLQIDGYLPYFNSQEWLNSLAKIPADSDNRLADFTDKINVRCKQAILAGREFNDISLNAEKLPEQSWAIHLKESKVDAHVNYDPHFNMLRGSISTLHLNKASLDMADNNEPFKVGDLPNMDLQINHVIYNNVSLGSLAIKAEALPSTWKINDLRLQSPFYQLNAKGKWQQNGSINDTSLEGELEINDLAKSLQLFGVTPAVEAPSGLIQFSGEWPGGITKFSLPKLSGDAYIRFKNGRITHLSPETEEKLGLGKLLSILSLQTIPRRLKLDFSDLSKEGYSFDIFEGHFNIAKGMMTTQDSYIDGPIAYASMKGNLDIARQLYNLDLRISPHITASLPIVATIAGGPIAGVATWLASKIINQGMQKISAYTYTISGPWREPLVEQTKIYKKKKLA